MESTLPKDIAFVFLRATKSECQEYAESWLADRKSRKGWLFVQKYGDGYILEMHDQGEGLAYLPGVLDKKEGAYGVIDMGDRYLVVEAGKRDVRTMVYDEPLPNEELLQPSSKMTRLIIDSSSYLFSSALICLLIAISAMFISISAMPAPGKVVVPEGNGGVEPYVWWLNEAHWGREISPSKITYKKGEGWKVEGE